MQLTQEAKNASDLILIGAIFAVVGFVSALGAPSRFAGERFYNQRQAAISTRPSGRKDTPSSSSILRRSSGSPPAAREPSCLTTRCHGSFRRAEAHGAAHLPRSAGAAKHAGDLAVGDDLARAVSGKRCRRPAGKRRSFVLRREKGGETRLRPSGFRFTPKGVGHSSSSSSSSSKRPFWTISMSLSASSSATGTNSSWSSPTATTSRCRASR